MTVTLSDVEINGKYYEEIDAEVEFNYTPGTPEERGWGYYGANPAFPAEVEITSVKINGKEVSKQLEEDTFSKIEEWIFDEIENNVPDYDDLDD